MFSNFAWSEILVIACVAIIVVGPKDLPGLLRGLGKTIGNVKRMANDFQRQFNDALREAELDEVADMAKNKTIAPLQDAKDAMEDFTKSISEPLEVKPAMEDKVAEPSKPVAETKTKKTTRPRNKAADNNSEPDQAKTTGAETTAKPRTTTRKPAARKKPAEAKKPAPRKTAPRKTAAKKKTESEA